MGVDVSSDRAAPLIRALVRDERLTHGLGDIEARMLIDWASAWAESLAGATTDPGHAQREVDRVRRRATVVSRFVRLWGECRTRPAACQLAAVERVTWPLPAGAVDAADLMHAVLSWDRPGDGWNWGDFGGSGQQCRSGAS